jgi:hypothetical protein
MVTSRVRSVFATAKLVNLLAIDIELVDRLWCRTRISRSRRRDVPAIVDCEWLLGVE